MAQSQRRLRPAEYGKWNRVYKRLARWCEQGVWERMLVDSLRLIDHHLKQ